MLTRFFYTCARDPDASGLLYYEFPQHFVWKAQKKTWTKRQKGDDKAIGRVTSVSPMDTERYYLRLLLCYVRGPKSFKDLRTVEGMVHETFREAAAALGLLADDSEWCHCMEEAASLDMPAQLRHLFAMILVYSQPQQPQKLWEKYANPMSEDYQHDRNSDASERFGLFKTIKDIDRHLHSNGKSLADFGSLPQLQHFEEFHDHNAATNTLLQLERPYNQRVLQDIADGVPMLNDGQKSVYDRIICAIEDPRDIAKVFFLDGPGGTGKSFLLDKILASVRAQKKIALAVAPSGIAALQLMGGRTAHSMFKLPLNLISTSACNVSVDSSRADLLRQASIIIWDGAPMSIKYAFESLDKTLQVLMKNNLPFGGKVVLTAGDFRQFLPVVPRAAVSQIVSACVKKSSIWDRVASLKISTNMRVQKAQTSSGAVEVRDFVNFLLKVGEAKHVGCSELGFDYVKTPSYVIVHPQSNTPPTKVLIDAIYGDIAAHIQDNQYFSARAILTPLSINVQAINSEIMERVPGQVFKYASIGSVEEQDGVEPFMFPVEFLNTLSISGMPPHKLRLKVGAPIMLLRNINGEQGLCNGARLQVRQLQRRCIEVAIMAGSRQGDVALVPRIPLIADEAGLPFKLRRRQFPVQVAFAMAINKSQGQTVHHLGLYLPQPVFSHGQLYVALSRATSKNNIKVLIDHPAHEEGDGICIKDAVYPTVV